MFLPKRATTGLAAFIIAIVPGLSESAEAPKAAGDLMMKHAWQVTCYVSAESLGLSSEATKYRRMAERSAEQIRSITGEQTDIDEAAAHIRNVAGPISPQTHRAMLNERCGDELK